MVDPFAQLEKGRYSVVLCDPPWSYITYTGQGTPHRTAEDHYEVLALADLKALPVKSLAARDCALIMWVIGSHLDQALELGRDWGFTYKTDLFTWVKTGKHDQHVRPISLGKWSRKQTEQALLFSTGNPKRLDAGVRQLIEADDNVIYAPKREHSRKPDEQYGRIERLVKGPYVELFARSARRGWTAWGDQTGRFPEPPIQSDVLELLGFPQDVENLLG